MRILKLIFKRLKEFYYSLLNPGVLFDFSGHYKRHSEKCGFRSQRGQEAYLLDQIFSYQKNLFFVEVGANHPTNDNNTYALEKNFGWNGISIDPIQKFESLWKKERSSTFVNACIADVDNTEVEFSEIISDSWESMLSGVDIERNLKFKDKGSSEVKKYKLKTTTLQNILEKNSITHIDALFIDTEGFELNVLKGINFSSVNIKVICFENDYHDKTLRNFLKNQNYIFKAHILGDDVFIKKSIQ